MAAGLTHYESTIESMEVTGIDLSKVFKKWMTSLDGRERRLDREMNGMVVPLLEPFTLPNGVKLRFPNDPEALRSATLGCRSVITIVVGR